MIDSLCERRAFWREHHVIECQGDSIAAPYESIEDFQALFTGQRVLEIGPGEGRQFKALQSLASSYAIADIVPEVLGRSMYIPASGRYLIEQYDECDFKECFDLITFWYVLHHVRLDEGPAFFDFLIRHLLPGGRLLFNAPHSNPTHEYAPGKGDGCATTKWDQTAISKLLKQRGFEVELQLEVAPNCLVLLASKN